MKQTNKTTVDVAEKLSDILTHLCPPPTLWPSGNLENSSLYCPSGFLVPEKNTDLVLKGMCFDLFGDILKI